MRKRTSVRAVWDKDVTSLLKSLGVLDSLVAGEFQCAVCSKSVDLENLGAIFSKDGAVKVTCDTISCVRIVTSAEVASPLG